MIYKLALRRSLLKQIDGYMRVHYTLPCFLYMFEIFYKAEFKINTHTHKSPVLEIPQPSLPVS